MIGDLLEGCHVNQARWLARLFNHSCLELDVVMVWYSIINSKSNHYNNDNGNDNDNDHDNDNNSDNDNCKDYQIDFFNV